MSPLTTIRTELAAGRWLSAWRLLAPGLAAGYTRGDEAFLRLAYTVATRVGADSQRYWLTRRALQCHPRRAFAWNQRLFDLVRRGRAFEAFELLESPDRPLPSDPDEALEAELAAARVASDLRDFDATDAALARAEALAPDDPRTLRERVWATLERDDAAAALALCRAARARFPEDAAFREQECWLLLQGRDPAPALAALEAVTAAGESPGWDHLHATALFDTGAFAEACAKFTRLTTSRPSERGRRTAAARLAARAARALGDDRGALAILAEAGLGDDVWASRLRAHLDSGAPAGSGRRVLPVPFVRQDHVTCSPATMASLLAHFGLEVDQREIAASITYDGTPSYRELEWAHGRGLAIHFFQFDAALARVLVDEGLPFAISTRGEQWAHRQALVGYDTALGTFILRDPGRNALVEVDADKLAREISVRGGDCAVIVPASEAARVRPERLPFARETTALQRLRAAYDARDLVTAERIAAEAPGWPECSARHEALLRIASERGDRRRELELWRDRYLELPEDAYCQYHYAAELRYQSRWGEFVALLEQHVPAGSPYLAMMLAGHLRFAAPTRAEAERLARHAILALRGQGAPLRLLADILWDDVAARPRAAAIQRLASCAARHDEDAAWASFQAYDTLGEHERALALLRARAAKYGSKSPEASLTLARGLDRQGRRAEALELLRATLAVHDRPEARAALFDLLVSDGQLDSAEVLLADAHRWLPLARERSRLALADARGDLAGAQAALTAAVALDGADPDLQVRRLRGLLALEGRAATVAELDRVIAAHGDDPRLLTELQYFCRDIEDNARSESLARRLVAEHPQEHWLRGRLARLLLNTGRAEEAEPYIATLLEATPDSPAVWMDAIESARARGDHALATQRANAAAARWPGDASFLRAQRALATSREGSVAAVRAALTALVASPRPPSGGDLEELAAAGEQDLPVRELDAALASLEARFPAAPAIGRVRARLLRERDPAAACAVAERLAAAHAFDPEHWLLHARCLVSAGRRTEGRARLEELLARAPATAQAWIDLGESLEQEGETAAAMRTYERGLAVAPMSPVLRGMRASLLWDLGERDAAVTEIDRAAELDTGYRWARRMQVVWRANLGDHDGALAAAEACVRDNPRWPFAHDLVATAFARLGRHEDRVLALRRALALDPRIGASRMNLLDALSELKRFDEAEAAISDGLALLGDQPELLLRRVELRHVRGDLDGARAELRALLAQHPDFERGWLRLLEWLDEAHRDDELLALAGAPPAVLKTAPALHGYAADSHWRLGDRENAVESLRRALELAPDYEWARDRLAELLLDLGRHGEVLALFPGATDPSMLPYQRAARVARAAAETGQRKLAEQTFLRLLRDPAAELSELRAVDAALTLHDARAQQRLLRSRLETSASARDVREHSSVLVVLAARGEWRRFWRAAEAFTAWLPEEARLEELGRLVYVAKRAGATKRIVPFVLRHLRGVVADPEAWGRVAFASSGKRGARALVELTGDDYRRPGVQGWMLANLASSLVTLERFDECAAVSEFALRELPQDHSVWWHRRYLAEVAYERRDFAACREWSVMSTAEYPTVKVAVAQLDTLAQMALARGWWARRRILSRALPELLRQWRLADAETRGSGDPTEMMWKRFFRLQPSLRALLLACGVWGRRRLERRDD